jgi:hypothetical protein
MRSDFGEIVELQSIPTAFGLEGSEAVFWIVAGKTFVHLVDLLFIIRGAQLRRLAFFGAVDEITFEASFLI